MINKELADFIKNVTGAGIGITFEHRPSNVLTVIKLHSHWSHLVLCSNEFLVNPIIKEDFTSKGVKGFLLSRDGVNLTVRQNGKITMEVFTKAYDGGLEKSGYAVLDMINRYVDVVMDVGSNYKHHADDRAVGTAFFIVAKQMMNSHKKILDDVQ